MLSEYSCGSIWTVEILMETVSVCLVSVKNVASLNLRYLSIFYFLSSKTKKAFTMYSLNPAWNITNNIVTSYKFEMSFFEIFLHYIIYCGYLYSLLRSFVYPNIISKEQFYVETKVVRRSSK